MKSGSLLDYYRYETDGVDDNASESKSFRYKTNIIEEMQGQPPQSGNAKSTDWTAQPLVVFLNVEVTIPTKYISNFWMSLNLNRDWFIMEKILCMDRTSYNTAEVIFMITSANNFMSQ